MSGSSDSSVVITHALRTPIGKLGGSFRSLSSVELGTSVVRSVLRYAGVPAADFDFLVFGNARQAGAGPNPARQIAVRAGVPETKPAFTVNMACASGLKAILLGADAIALGRARFVIAGGTESMTNLPYLLPKMRYGYRIGNDRVVDAMYQDGFVCPLSGLVMGETAEKLAHERSI
ncbi:MAG TPA: beta-ketoacyl synthase N-terminal-like domain-containing protein, partial [Planctomycetota bacterium]|nr:beta-ketoacyl synthase N-terminal-like domain-containing protein [Planctomycetota bacterium]